MISTLQAKNSLSCGWKNSPYTSSCSTLTRRCNQVHPTLKIPIKWQQSEPQEAPRSIRGIAFITKVLSQKIESQMQFHSIKPAQINTHQNAILMNTGECIRQIGQWGDWWTRKVVTTIRLSVHGSSCACSPCFLQYFKGYYPNFY